MMAWLAWIRIGLGALLLGLGGQAAAQSNDLAAALALPVASDLTGAAEAPRFAWVENETGVRNIWVADKGRPAKRITAFAEDDGVQLYDVTFSRDGSSLAYVRGGDAEFPDDPAPNAGSAATPPKQQVFMVRASGGTPSLIGEGHSPAFAPDGRRIAFTRDGEIWLWERGEDARRLAVVRGDVTRLSWSPDGRRLLFVDNRANHSFVVLIDVEEARVAHLDPALGYSVEPTFSPDGSQVALIRYMDPPAGATGEDGSYWSIRVADVASGEARLLWQAPAGIGGRYAGTRSRNLFWSADDKIIFPWERSGWIHPYAIDAAGGSPRELTPGAFEVETFLLGPDKRSLIYAANAGDLNRRHIWRVPVAGGEPERLTTGQGIESYPTLGGDALAVIATDAARPAYVAAVDRSLVPLGRSAAMPGWAAPEAVTFKAADGVLLHGQLFRAAGSGKRPALVYVHGGPRRQMLLGFHPSGYYSKAYAMNQHLAARGYDVLAINYRSGTGYGRAFRDAPGIAREGASEYRDILAAGRWLAARPEVDPKRIGIWGGSWGGYLAALALARDSDLFAAGVDFHGVHSMLRPVSNSLSPEAQAAARQLQWDSSPLGAIEKWRSPVLLIHGDDDRNVDFAQSLVLARELAARGVTYEELVFPNERHSFFRHAHWLESLLATEDFLNRHLMRKGGER